MTTLENVFYFIFLYVIIGWCDYKNNEVQYLGRETYLGNSTLVP